MTTFVDGMKETVKQAVKNALVECVAEWGEQHEDFWSAFDELISEDLEKSELIYNAESDEFVIFVGGTDGANFAFPSIKLDIYREVETRGGLRNFDELITRLSAARASAEVRLKGQQAGPFGKPKRKR